jgi:hypothetical protein
MPDVKLFHSFYFLLTLMWSRIIFKIMKYCAVIVLIALSLTVLAPPSFALALHGDKAPVLGALDVCHTATPALSANGEIPCVNACAALPLPLALNKVADIVNPPIHPIHIAFQDEIPPKN